jgi:hypothetical protein
VLLEQECRGVASPALGPFRVHDVADEIEPGRRKCLADPEGAVSRRGVPGVARDVRDAGASAVDEVLDRDPAGADVVRCE